MNPHEEIELKLIDATNQTNRYYLRRRTVTNCIIQQRDNPHVTVAESID